MHKQNDWKERFDGEFSELRFGDGSPEGSGKSAYRVVKENTSLDDIKSFIEKVVSEAEERGRDGAVEYLKKHLYEEHMRPDEVIFEEARSNTEV